MLKYLGLVFLLATTPVFAGPPSWTPTQASTCGWNDSVQNELASILNGTTGAVSTVRTNSKMPTQLAGFETKLRTNLKSLLQFQITDYAGNCIAHGSGTVDLLPIAQNFTQYMRCPDNPVGAGCTNSVDAANHQTSLFQEDAVYSIGPWMEGYAPNTGQLMNHQIFDSGGLWDQVASIANVCQDDMDRYVIGQLPGWDGGAWIDPAHVTVHCLTG